MGVVVGVPPAPAPAAPPAQFLRWERGNLRPAGHRPPPAPAQFLRLAIANPKPPQPQFLRPATDRFRPLLHQPGHN